VRAALRYRGDGPTIKALRDRYLVSEARGLETGGSPGSSGQDVHSEPDGPFGWRCRVWYAGVNPGGGGRYRVELELPREVYPGGGVDIIARDGRIVGSSGTDTVVNSRIGGSPREDDPLWLVLAQDSFRTTYLFDSADIAGLPILLDRLDLRVEGKTRKTGREAIRLVGVSVEEWQDFPEPLWWGRTSTRSWWTPSAQLASCGSIRIQTISPIRRRDRTLMSLATGRGKGVASSYAKRGETPCCEGRHYYALGSLQAEVPRLRGAVVEAS
jgi:hypothetical protein